MKNEVNIHSLPSICAGQAHEIARGIHEKSGAKALQHLLRHLPGLKIRYFKFDHRGLTNQKELMDESKVDQGSDYIEEQVRLIQ
eukprot:5868456-Pyramimonas_sp.AAC.1